MNQLYYGDNLQVLRDHIAKQSVDLSGCSYFSVFETLGQTCGKRGRELSWTVARTDTSR